MIQHKRDYNKKIREDINTLANPKTGSPFSNPHNQDLSNTYVATSPAATQPLVSNTPVVDTTRQELKLEDAIISEFQVAPLDLTVSDYTSPTFYITKDKLFFAYDDLIEEYNLADLEFSILGDEPHFSVLEQITEAKYQYAEYKQDLYKQMKNDEVINRLSMNEPGQLPKSYTLRKGRIIAKPYQNWAMCQSIINMKNGIQRDPIIEEMIQGSFTQFNTQAILTFAGIFIGYFVLTLLLSALGVTGIIRSIVDLLFAGVSLVMLAWTYLSVEKNNKRFYSTYLRYK